MAILKNTIINGILRTNKLWLSDQNIQDINTKQSKLILADNDGNIIPANFTSVANKVLAQNGSWVDLPTKYSLPIATKTALGGVSLFNDGVLEKADKVYPVQLNSLHQMLVSVPWTDTNTWLPNEVNQDGYVSAPTATNKNKVWKTDSSGVPGWRDDADTNTTYSVATSSVLGLVKIGYNENGKNYPIELDSDNKMFVNVPWENTPPNANTWRPMYTNDTLRLSATGGTDFHLNDGKNTTVRYATGGNFYIDATDTNTWLPNEVNQDGYVSAPTATNKNKVWKTDDKGNPGWRNDNNTTYSQATSSSLGLVRIGYNENGKNYPVELDSNGQMFVNVPWTDNNTTYSQATSSSLGLVKLGNNSVIDSGTDKTYPIQLNSSGQMFVNVPWINTTYDLDNYVTFTKNNNINVLGTAKTTYTYNQTPIYAPNGLIMGGSAQSAGLVTRGICGIMPPGAGGSCTKTELFINYDGDNEYRANRQLVLQAGSVGDNYGNNLYQYAAARGDAVKNWVEAKGYITEITDFSTPTYKIHFDYSGSNLASNQWIAGFERNENDVYLRVTPSNGLPLTTATTNELKKYVALSGEQEISGTKTFKNDAGLKIQNSNGTGGSASMKYDPTKKCLKFVFTD